MSVVRRLRQPRRNKAAFLELVLSDEVARHEYRSVMLRARTAGLNPAMRWTPGTTSPTTGLYYPT